MLYQPRPGTKESLIAIIKDPEDQQQQQKLINLYSILQFKYIQSQPGIGAPLNTHSPPFVFPSCPNSVHRSILDLWVRCITLNQHLWGLT